MVPCFMTKSPPTTFKQLKFKDSKYQIIVLNVFSKSTKRVEAGFYFQLFIIDLNMFLILVSWRIFNFGPCKHEPMWTINEIIIILKWVRLKKNTNLQWLKMNKKIYWNQKWKKNANLQWLKLEKWTYRVQKLICINLQEPKTYLSLYYLILFIPVSKGLGIESSMMTLKCSNGCLLFRGISCCNSWLKNW